MLLIISPAKSLNMEKVKASFEPTYPYFIDEAETLVGVLKKYKPARLEALMRINPKLAQLNFERFQEWSRDADLNSKPALLSFIGEVFRGIDANSFSKEDMDFVQDHLLIFSGLYGALRPFDLIHAYRLEMGTPLKFRRNKNLYDFWKKKITDFTLNQMADNKQSVLVNLASREYFKSISPYLGKTRIITPIFKEERNGGFKFIHSLGKRARGLMVRYIVQNRITDVEQIKLFDLEGYYFNDQLTQDGEWVFTR